ncbi:MAG: alpha/beta hydrolase [Cyanobacteria bacterium J055]|nr:MAG: alpha/beta hydrolase [Cyanobacteria bacterium J055]
MPFRLRRHRAINRILTPRLIGNFLAGGVLAISLCQILKPAVAADRIYASYAVLERSISIAALEEYAKNGKIEEDLAVYARYVTPDDLEELRKILRARADLDPVVISQFLYTRQGEVLLKRLGEVIQSGSGNSGFYGLRAALILAAADDEGLTLLNVLRQFPTSEIRVNLQRALQMAQELQGWVNQTKRAIDGVERFATADAREKEDDAIEFAEDLQKPGNQRWQKRSLQFSDRGRKILNISKDRKLDTDIYLPQRNDGQPAPTLVISHSLGSTRKTFAYLAEHLASHGFAVVVPQHPGSDARQLEALMTGVAREVAKPEEFVDRPLDITFILDELESLERNNPEWKNTLDLQRVGIIGQSFGGYTALALAGAPINFDRLHRDCRQEEESWNVSLFLQCRAQDLKRRDEVLRDDRIQGAIAINPLTSSVFGQESLSQIQIPVAIVSGGADTVAPALVEQIQPFTWLSAPDKYLLLMKSGTHFSTLGQEEGVVSFPPEAIGPNPALAQRYMKAFSLAFAETYIADRSAYKPYLSSSYIRSLSQESIPLSLIRSLGETQLAEMLGRRSPLLRNQ